MMLEDRIVNIRIVTTVELVCDHHRAIFFLQYFHGDKARARVGGLTINSFM